MEYRRVGRSGLKVSALAFGTSSYPFDSVAGKEYVAAGLDAGVNFFDTAEVYMAGQAERILGDALQALKIPRTKYVVATKFAVGLGEGPNECRTLNRKYLIDAIDGSLERLQLDYVDIVYCHWPDPHTPLEETVWALHNIIESGKALYWGTSNFSAEHIRAAWELAERHHLHKPIVEQSEYNLLYRSRIDAELHRLTDDIGLGITVYSPLAGGLLSGKYRNGVPAESRAALPGLDAYRPSFVDAGRNEIVGGLEAIADELGVSITHLALAWCLSNPKICSLMLGASRLAQMTDNLKAMEALPKLTPEVLKRIGATIGTYNGPWMPPPY